MTMTKPTHLIRIDEDVDAKLIGLSKEGERPNDVLRRVLGLPHLDTPLAALLRESIKRKLDEREPHTDPCDVCGQPGTDEHPCGWGECAGIETYGHAGGCPGKGA